MHIGNFFSVTVVVVDVDSADAEYEDDISVVNHEMSHIIHLALHLLSLFFILSFRTTCDSDF